MIFSRADIVRMEYIYGLQSKKKFCIFMTGTTGGAIIAAARTGNLSMRRSFLFPRTRQERRPFFHFDFHNLHALHQTILDGEFVEPDNPDLPHFLEQARRLRSGEQDWFVGALYYPLFFTGDAFLQRLRPERRPADTAAFPVCTALLRGNLSPGGAPPHSGGADALGGDTVPTPVRPAVFPVRLHKFPAGRRPWSSLRMRCG